jgi:hypothetical protein
MLNEVILSPEYQQHAYTYNNPLEVGFAFIKYRGGCFDQGVLPLRLELLAGRIKTQLTSNHPPIAAMPALLFWQNISPC